MRCTILQVSLHYHKENNRLQAQICRTVISQSISRLLVDTFWLDQNSDWSIFCRVHFIRWKALIANGGVFRAPVSQVTVCLQNTPLVFTSFGLAQPTEGERQIEESRLLEGLLNIIT